MISERIFNEEVSLEEIINMILEQQIDIIFHKIYSKSKVNTATSIANKEDVVE